ncbi:anaerobic ribonucleoside-triphosphate reductase activating protein [Boudabousia liubingyangii]|uniref:Anaerobic ribonucleoside-triphosphate reductase activating protein n=1 Tax=Boudabousia liubingyangii TaxID=1921764 RepID=A0A1Q5PK25_9ACTO|nr:anaerobic ribonucleoside-triphosphate reductase activating protein [Boudabousia liubingyangii]OKL46542.1 anaerobic ribonucleoside-triphosphate reductase activating protein [Boudabousia liubingyangii]OKL46873.1 anaerobic ribonucleoside-triphosphate reductase activating protein [Boudabousia liubingyangii]
MSGSDLRIAGLDPFSMVDWPGKLVATVFLQGCPWRCAYCHNHQILDPRQPGRVSVEELMQVAQSRLGFLDGLVFSGGEPLMQGSALERLLPEFKVMGYELGLHTGGAFPRALRSLLAAGCLDWVGLDVKALPRDYPRVVGRPAAVKTASVVAESLEAWLESGIAGEVRVTVYPGGSDWLTLVEELLAQGVPALALQQARAVGAAAGFQPLVDRKFVDLAAAAQELADQAGVPLEVRPAAA